MKKGTLLINKLNERQLELYEANADVLDGNSWIKPEDHYFTIKHCPPYRAAEGFKISIDEVEELIHALVYNYRHLDQKPC